MKKLFSLAAIAMLVSATVGCPSQGDTEAKMPDLEGGMPDRAKAVAESMQGAYKDMKMDTGSEE